MFKLSPYLIYLHVDDAQPQGHRHPPSMGAASLIFLALLHSARPDASSVPSTA